MNEKYQKERNEKPYNEKRMKKMNRNSTNTTVKKNRN